MPGRLLASSAFVFALLVQSNAGGFNPEHPAPPFPCLFLPVVGTYVHTQERPKRVEEFGLRPPPSLPPFFSPSRLQHSGRADPQLSTTAKAILLGGIFSFFFSLCILSRRTCNHSRNRQGLCRYKKILFSSSKAVCFSWQMCLALFATVRNILGPFLSGKKKLLLINGDLSNNSKGGRERAVRSRSQESLKPPLPGNSCFQSPVPPLG